MDRTQTLRSLRDFLCDEAGATAIGYLLIIAVVMAMGPSLNAMY